MGLSVASPDPIQRLILELGRLPGIGERSATRLAFHIIRDCHNRGGGPSKSLAQDLAAALLDVTVNVGLCPVCQNLCSKERCPICADTRRNQALLCVVESVQDLRAIESTGQYFGLYHVLHGAICPLDGVGPEELKLNLLLERLKAHVVKEVILATNTDVEGDTTAMYLARLIAPLGLVLTRLASGVPLGGELEFIDQATLSRAILTRQEFLG